jgi:aldehyde:ferredoxin oxidoreductase
MYGGTILRVDLSEGTISREPTTSYSNDYLGGRGINVRILYDEVQIKHLYPRSMRANLRF